MTRQFQYFLCFVISVLMLILLNALGDKMSIFYTGLFAFMLGWYFIRALGTND